MATSGLREGDGRAARSQRTRDAAARAVLDLVQEGNLTPTVTEIAARVGVTPRSLYGHFPSVSDLHRAAASLATTELASQLEPIDVDQPLAERIDAVCAQRAVVHEYLAPLRRAARLAESSPGLTEARTNALDASNAQIERVFATELAPLTPTARRRLIALLASVLGDDAWELWRQYYSMSVDAARATMAEGARAQLAAVTAG